MADLTRKEIAYLRRLARPAVCNIVDKSHWYDPTFQKMREAGFVRYLKPSLRNRQVVITVAGRAALAGAN